MANFIQVHRKIIEWEWYKNNNTKSLFIHCLLKANWCDKSWQGLTINRGQFVTSVDTLSKELGLKTQQIRTALNNLILTNEITKETTNKFTVITVIKYDDYQIITDDDNKQNNKEENNQLTNKQQTNNKQITTTNKDNNYNNKNKKIKDIVGIDYAQVVSYLNQKSNKNFRVTDPTKKLINARVKEGFTIDNFYTVIDNQCSKWLNDDKMNEFLRPQTLFSNKFESYLNSSKSTKGKSVLDRLKDL